MLKFLADVNVEKPIIDFLKEDGYDVIWIPDYDPKVTDAMLLDLANREERILITNDKDFGELMFLQKKVSKGIILFRIKGQDIKKKIRNLKRILVNYQDEIPNHFVVVSERKLRFTSMEEI